MEIVLFTMGTRGDVQPYIYLAEALNKAGHQTTIGTHPCWEKLVTGAQIAFVPIGPDVNIEYEAAVIRGKTKNPILSMLRTMQFVFRIIEQSSGDIYENCKGKDLVIVSHSQMGAIEAEALNIRTVNITLQTEMIPEVGKPKSPLQRIFGALIDAQMVKPYNKIRKLYHLPKVTKIDQIMSPTLDIIPQSRYVAEQNPYWEKKHRIVGYWYNRDEHFEPDEELLSFIRAGEKPIILSLGAMAFESGQEKQKLDAFVQAFRKTGMRAIIQGFEKTLADYPLPETMMRVGSVPHSWLFRQGFCVIHHCGFGTSAAAMLYGVPSIPVPHVLDQFAFADRLFQLGVSVKPIRANELSTERVAQAIEEVKANDTGLRERVSTLSQKMQDENGLETAVALIQADAGW
ncbi:MAG: glycosyltransferase [Clostridiaceae bacterium]